MFAYKVEITRGPLSFDILGSFFSFSFLVENTIAHVYEPGPPVTQQATTGTSA